MELNLAKLAELAYKVQSSNQNNPLLFVTSEKTYHKFNQETQETMQKVLQQYTAEIILLPEQEMCEDKIIIVTKGE